MKEIKEKLFKIQQELKAPKSQTNKFGGYKYRNCEDILEAVKPLLKETETVLVLNDELVNIGERYYVKATATLFDDEDAISNSAYAREEENKKGMDGSQITGASSSYARKYALNGLFSIDDTRDSDTTNTGEEPKEQLITDAQKLVIKDKFEKGIIKEYLQKLGKERLGLLTIQEASDLIKSKGVENEEQQ